MNKQQQESARAKKISDVLTHSCEQLNHDIVLRLHQSREAALQSSVAQRQTILTLNTGHFSQLLPHSGIQWLLALLMLAIVIIGTGGYWQHSSKQELSHVDIAILTDDLPLEVFVDK